MKKQTNQKFKNLTKTRLNEESKQTDVQNTCSQTNERRNKNLGKKINTEMQRNPLSTVT